MKGFKVGDCVLLNDKHKYYVIAKKVECGKLLYFLHGNKDATKTYTVAEYKELKHYEEQNNEN